MHTPSGASKVRVPQTLQGVQFGVETVLDLLGTDLQKVRCVGVPLDYLWLSLLEFVRVRRLKRLDGLDDISLDCVIGPGERSLA